MRALIAICLALIATAANAQFAIGLTGRAMLIMMPDVQKELKITKDQKKQIQDATKDMQSQMEGNMPSMTGGFDMEAMTEKMDAPYVAILTDDQNKRMTELWLQYNGPGAMHNKKVADELKLTDDQRKQIDQLVSDFNKTALEKMQHARSNGDMDKIKKIHAVMNDAVLALLTEDQKKAFTDMEGKEFKFKQKPQF